MRPMRPMHLRELAGLAVLITGAASGIGRPEDRS